MRSVILDLTIELPSRYTDPNPLEVNAIQGVDSTDDRLGKGCTAMLLDTLNVLGPASFRQKQIAISGVSQQVANLASAFAVASSH